MLWCLLGLLCFSKFSCILPVLSLLLGERLCLLLGEGLCLLLGSGLWRGPLSGSADLPARCKVEKEELFYTFYLGCVLSLENFFLGCDVLGYEVFLGCDAWGYDAWGHDALDCGVSGYDV